MDEIQKAKRGIILNCVGFCIGLCTLLIDIIPVIAIGAIIFCPIYAIKDLKKYQQLKRSQLEQSSPYGSSTPQEYFGL